MMMPGGASPRPRTEFRLDDRDAMLIDAMLVLKAQAGDAGAMRGLVERWDGRLRTHAAHLLRGRDGGTDATQEAWVAIVRKIGSLRDPERFGPWAMRIVTNKCRDVRRKRTARPGGPFATHDQPRVGLEPAEAAPDERVEGVRLALRAIAPDDRALLSLRYAARLPLASIGAAMGLPVGTVKSRLHAARAAVRSAVESTDGCSDDGANRKDKR